MNFYSVNSKQVRSEERLWLDSSFLRKRTVEVTFDGDMRSFWETCQPGQSELRQMDVVLLPSHSICTLLFVFDWVWQICMGRNTGNRNSGHELMTQLGQRPRISCWVASDKGTRQRYLLYFKFGGEKTCSQFLLSILAFINKSQIGNQDISFTTPYTHGEGHLLQSAGLH